MQKILIATEGSPEAREAVEYGLQLAEEQGATMPETILVAYGTKHGSTREVAETVAASIARCGLEVETRPAGQVGDLSLFGGVVVGGAIYMGRWHPAFNRLPASDARDWDAIREWASDFGKAATDARDHRSELQHVPR